MSDEELIQLALQMRKRAYAPYSRFYVGAAILCEDGRTYGGCNIENAAFGAGVCAERCALSAAFSDGNHKFSKLAVAGNGEAFCTPCGICRQMFFEFAPDMPVLCANEKGEYQTYLLKELLPHGFGSFQPE